jgi:hypothetical protein
MKRDFVKPVNETDPIAAAERSAIATNIEDFILNRATIAEVETIFATLGTRFKELVHGGQTTTTK